MAKQNTAEVYSYCNGKKVILYKKDDVLTGAAVVEKVSPRSTRNRPNGGGVEYVYQ